MTDEERSFEFHERLSGKNRNFYTFTLDQLHVSNGATKFAVTVHRESLDEANATLNPDYHYVEVGQCAPIRPTDWELRLDRTAQSRAIFTVERTKA